MEIISETWIPIPVKEFGYSYLISDFGRIKSISRHIVQSNNKTRFVPGRIMKLIEGKTSIKIAFSVLGGYELFNVNFLVAKAFISNPYDHKFIRHLDGNLLNVHASNLEWSFEKPLKWQLA